MRLAAIPLVLLFICAGADAQVFTIRTDGDACLNKGKLQVKKATLNRCYGHVATECIGDDLSIHVVAISNRRGQIPAQVGGPHGTRLFLDVNRDEHITLHGTVKCKGKPEKNFTFEFTTR